MLPLTVREAEVKDRPNPFEDVIRRVGGTARMSVAVAAIGLTTFGALTNFGEPYDRLIRISPVILTGVTAAILKNMTPASRERDMKKLLKTQIKIEEVVTQFWKSLASKDIERCSSLFKELKAKDTSGCTKKFEESFKGTLAEIEQTLKSAKKQLREQAE